MVRILIINVLIITGIILAVNAKGYCVNNLCPNGVKHIACRNEGNFAARCPKNARMVNLRPHRLYILNMFNSKRNQIAGGRLRRYKPAKRMSVMQWDNELAKLAALNVKQCRMRHDKCRNTRRFANSGQNLATISYTDSSTRYSTKYLLKNRINAWWNEYKNANMRIIRSYPRNHKGAAIGHFTVFVNERNTRVGCAASRYKKGKNNNFLIACNFATTNIYGKSVYRPGRSGRGCRSGRNSVFKSLCSGSERYTGLK